MDLVVSQLVDLGSREEGLHYQDFLTVMRTADSGNSQKILEAFQVREVIPKSFC